MPLHPLESFEQVEHLRIGDVIFENVGRTKLKMEIKEIITSDNGDTITLIGRSDFKNTLNRYFVEVVFTREHFNYAGDFEVLSPINTFLGGGYGEKIHEGRIRAY